MSPDEPTRATTPSASVATPPPDNPEPTRPRRPTIPPDLAKYVEDNPKDPAYDTYPLTNGKRLFLARLSRARLPVVGGAVALYLVSALFSFFLGGQPISWGTLPQVLLPPRLLQLAQASPWLLGALGVLVVGALAVLFVFGARAHEHLEREGQVMVLRKELADWRHADKV